MFGVKKVEIAKTDEQQKTEQLDQKIAQSIVVRKMPEL